MENKCPFCENETIIKGKIESSYGVTFIPDDQKGLAKKSSMISALACKKCGAVFGMKLTDKPCKLTD